MGRVNTSYNLGQVMWTLSKYIGNTDIIVHVRVRQLCAAVLVQIIDQIKTLSHSALCRQQISTQ